MNLCTRYVPGIRVQGVLVSYIPGVDCGSATSSMAPVEPSKSPGTAVTISSTALPGAMEAAAAAAAAAGDVMVGHVFLHSSP